MNSHQSAYAVYSVATDDMDSLAKMIERESNVSMRARESDEGGKYWGSSIELHTRFSLRVTRNFVYERPDNELVIEYEEVPMDHLIVSIGSQSVKERAFLYLLNRPEIFKLVDPISIFMESTEVWTGYPPIPPEYFE